MKTRKNRKSRKSWKIFKSEFSILAVGQNQKLGITFPRFLRFPTFRSFRFVTFSFSFLIFSPFCKSSLIFLHERNMISCVYVLVYSIKCIHNIEYKMYLQNEKMPKLWVFVAFSNKRRFEQIYKTSLQNETVR